MARTKTLLAPSRDGDGRFLHQLIVCRAPPPYLPDAPDAPYLPHLPDAPYLPYLPRPPR